jgi:hypothetical protein
VTRWLSPIAEKELLPPPPAHEDMALAPLTVILVAAALGFAWSAVDPLALTMRHLTLLLASILVFTGAVAGMNRSNTAIAERIGGNYETLLLSGASGWRLVLGLVQGGVLKSLLMASLTLPAFAACVAALGTPLARLAAFVAVFVPWLVMIHACGVLAGSGALPEARGSRPANTAIGVFMLPTAYAIAPPFLSMLILIPIAGLAVSPVAFARVTPVVGDLHLLPALFCPTGVFAIASIRLCGVAVPFVPLAIAANLALAAWAMACAAPMHRQHRYDLTQQRRAFTALGHLALLAIATASSSTAPGGAPLFALTVIELLFLLACAPDASSPGWPGTGAGDTPGRGRLADLFRERCGTGVAFVALLVLTAAPFFALAAPPGMRLRGCEAWLLTAVCGLAWTLCAFQLPPGEAARDSGLRVRLGIGTLMLIAASATFWNEPALSAQAPFLVAPMRWLLSAAVLVTPVGALLRLADLLVPWVLPPTTLLNLWQLLGRNPERIYWHTISVHAALAIAFWVRNRLRVRRAGRSTP